jgi:hypothetical protein
VTLGPRARRLALTAHVVASVGWLGAVAAFLAIAVAALASDDADLVRGAYLTMEVAGWAILLPLAVASLLTGLVQSLGTQWGLFRHYWVIAKLGINVFATIVLLMYMETLDSFADVAAATTGDDVSELQTASPALHAALAVVLLVVATVFAVYKPRGVTPYGRRRLSR